MIFFCDMKAKKFTYEQFASLVDKYKATISQVAAAFYAPGTYLFRELVCDLITYLWLVCREFPADVVIFREEQWLFTLLYRRALILTRNESRYQQHYVYGADLSYLADTATTDPLVKRLYRLIAMLGADDQKLIMRYIAKVPVRQIAKERRRSEMYVYRHIARICDELRRLDAVTEEDDDFPLDDKPSGSEYNNRNGSS